MHNYHSPLHWVLTPRKIPLWLKLVYTLFMGVLVPFYWREYGPTNFIWFCDIALFVVLVAIWIESPFLASMQLVAILLPQILWMVDFLSGATLIGSTEYMFDVNIRLFARGLSFFHFWLPILLVYMVWRLGYDKKAWIFQFVVAWIVFPVSYFMLPGPPKPEGTNEPVNLNYVYGFGNEQQTWIEDPDVYFLLMMILYPLLIFYPAHLLACWLLPERPPPGVENRAETGDKQ